MVVPPEPVVPLHINFLIHIEDPPALQNVEPYFHQQSAIFSELARTLYEHGGFLTIQPEQDWPMGAQKFDPGLLAELAQEYDVKYSNHTHGPNCRDADGLLRSAADCQPGWEAQMTEDDVIEYAGAMARLLEEASGQMTMDHNGNFDFIPKGRFYEIPIYTLSGYKNRHTQRTYDRLITNPWRPGEVNAEEDLEGFLRHDADTEVVYIPGWGQAISRHPERTAERFKPMVSQFIRHATPERINTFYVVLHVSFFTPRSGDAMDYLAYDELSGEVHYSEEFLQHLGYYDALLTEVVDPLVAEGYLEWTSLPDLYQLYISWEEHCEIAQSWFVQTPEAE